ncbi:MAG TPA: hypothetical protein DCZ30_05140 [Clostridiales bacterium]|nr:hypothetical protein [Clostridiales bacterium]
MKNKLKILDYILIITLLITIMIIVIIVIKSLEKKSIQNNAINNEKNITDIKQDNSGNELKNMSERERMEFYFSEFMDYIENGKYQEAYNLLYPDFKDNYFKTLDDFKKYVNKTYPEFVSFSYNDIERQGNIYVLMITVINPDLNKSEAKKSQRIVIKENNFNDFVLSFQVI